MEKTNNSDLVLSVLEKQLPSSKDDSRILSDAAQKVQIIRTWLLEHAFDSILVSRRDNFAWLTMGGENHVLKNTEIGVGHLLITPHKQYLLAYSMDGDRLMEEQVNQQGYELITTRWNQDDPRMIALTLGGKNIASDHPIAGMKDCSVEIGRLHDPLTEIEMNRIRWLARQTGLVFEQMAPIIHPGMSELEIARLFSDAFADKQIELDVLLVGTDDRTERFRHYLPSPRKLERYVLINPSARRWGLHANVSRCIHFGPPKESLRKHFEDASIIAANILGMLSPGLTFSDVLEQMKVNFHQCGYPEGWLEHFPGGVTGYMVADCRSLTDLCMVRQQAYDWFVTLPGVMVEELSLYGENGLEIPSLGKEWPCIPISHKHGQLYLPAMLQS